MYACDGDVYTVYHMVWVRRRSSVRMLPLFFLDNKMRKYKTLGRKKDSSHTFTDISSPDRSRRLCCRDRDRGCGQRDK